MRRKAIVFIVAHPDDVAFTFGGTAWLLKGKYDLYVFCASKGERGYDPRQHNIKWKGRGLVPPNPAVARKRAAEEKASCNLLGAKLTFLGELDGEIQPSRKVCAKVSRMLSSIRPVAVLTHSPFDKKDHSAVFSIAYLALHEAGLFWTTDIYTAEAYDPTRCNIFVDITKAVEGKKRLVSCHQCQTREGMEKEIEQILDRNRVLGKMSTCKYAEAFSTVLPLANSRWGRKAEPGSVLLGISP